LNVFSLLFDEIEILGDLSITTLEIKENLANSRILEQPFAVGTGRTLRGGTSLWLESREKLVDIVANTRARIDIMMEVDNDAASKKVKRAIGKCKVSEASMLIPLTTRRRKTSLTVEILR
jgi:hypothetical protein